jgi:hypothetical protein
MAFTFVNFSGGGQNGGSFSSSTTAAQNVTSGNSLVVLSRYPCSHITDTAGNIYTKLPFISWTASGNLGDGVSPYFCNNVVGASNLQVTTVFGPGGLDQDTFMGAWQFTGGSVAWDQNVIGQSGSSASTQTVTVNPRSQYVACFLSALTAVSTFTANAPLTLDGGSSILGNQRAGASHAIFSGFKQQALSTNSSASSSWMIAGPMLRVIPPQSNFRNVIFSAAAPAAPRTYSYWITLERLR